VSATDGGKLRASRPVDLVVPPPAETAAAAAAAGLTVYWRPGCGFCSMLLRQLDRHGLDPVVVNIWEDAAARRWLDDAIGSQTVPTVRVGERLLVNPDIDEVLAALA
jgi:mycoredoxin